MRFLSLPIVFVVVLLTSVAASSQIPQTPGSNVVISQCNLRQLNNVAESNFRVTPYKSGLQAVLSIDYQNQASVPMTAVAFGVVSAGKLVGIGVDSGRFSQGAEISHQLILNGPPLQLGAQTRCMVLRVLYENGSAWFNPSSPKW